MTCQRCKVKMDELKGHVYHNQRKFRCPTCKRHKMQKHTDKRRSQRFR